MEAPPAATAMMSEVGPQLGGSSGQGWLVYRRWSLCYGTVEPFLEHRPAVDALLFLPGTFPEAFPTSPLFSGEELALLGERWLLGRSR